MPLELAKVIRLKGLVDAAVAASPPDPLTATPVLIETYNRARTESAELVAGMEAEDEFRRLFPLLGGHSSIVSDPINAAVEGDRARSLLAQLCGWLSSWPSAERLLAELVTALEAAEAQADEPAEKARLRGLIDGPKGAGRDIAVSVVSAYLERVHARNYLGYSRWFPRVRTRGPRAEGSRGRRPSARGGGAAEATRPPVLSGTATGGTWAALDPATGAINWQVASPGNWTALGPATVANGVVYVSDMNPSGNNMFALDSSNGNVLWSFAAGGWSTPARRSCTTPSIGARAMRISASRPGRATTSCTPSRSTATDHHPLGLSRRLGWRESPRSGMRPLWPGLSRRSWSRPFLRGSSAAPPVGRRPRRGRSSRRRRPGAGGGAAT